jgi:thiol-disulfide isomerase/thioredoxin/Tfp pilus assembly protein PilF
MKHRRLSCFILQTFIPQTFVLLIVAFPPCLSAQQTSAVDPAFEQQMERGRAVIREHKYKDAVEPLKSANKLQHDSCGECNFLLAVAYMHLRDESHAMESCDKVLAVAQTDELRALAHNLRGNMLLAEAGPDVKKMGAAESEFRAAVQLQPKTPVFHMNLAKALLRESKDDLAKQELQVCLDCNPDETMKTEAGKLLADPNRGRETIAPDFQFTSMQGQQLSLQGLAGRVIVMDFWATWCPPCRESVPELKELTRKYPLKKLVLISVSADKDEQQWREFVAKKKMDWAQYRDADKRIMNSFDIHSFPTYLVINGDGVIKERITGLNPQESVVHRLRDTLGRMPQLEGEVRK